MGAGGKCRECDAVIPADAPAGLCARCLLLLGLEQARSPADTTLSDSASQSETSEPPRDAPRPPQFDDQIRGYKILDQIGHGGFGVVYLAEQEEPVRRRVALKIIKLGMDTKQVVARFQAERRALALMDHPNIAKILEAGATEAGRPYFVMELVPGLKITDYCDQNHLTTPERLDLFMQVCRAVLIRRGSSTATSSPRISW